MFRVEYWVFSKDTTYFKPEKANIHLPNSILTSLAKVIVVRTRRGLFRTSDLEINRRFHGEGIKPFMTYYRHWRIRISRLKYQLRFFFANWQTRRGQNHYAYLKFRCKLMTIFQEFDYETN